MMIIELMKYKLKYYMRSLKYTAPVLAFAAFLVINYSQRPIEIWGNYFVTAVAIFIFSAWITFGFNDFEDATQQQLTILHSGREKLYYLSNILSVWAFVFIFDLIIVFMPILRGMFSRSITIGEIIIAVVIHTVYSLLGIAIALAADSKLIPDRQKAILLLLILVISSVAQLGIIREYSFLKYIIWILPPIAYLSQSLNNLGENMVYSISGTFMIFIVHSFIYFSVIVFAYLKLVVRRKI